MVAGCFSSDSIVVKAPTDKRLYRILYLPNGLCALLVHDPEILSEDQSSELSLTEKSQKSDEALESFSEEEEDEGEGEGEEEGEEEEEDEEEEEEDEEEEEEDDDDDDEEDNEEEGEEDGEEVFKKKGKKGYSPGVSPTKKAAAAMCVGMGSFSDPLDAQGLAHFLEHMLFMGSAAFPDENEYDSYLAKHGGSSNAYTETEHTCYHFEVNREFLRDALKRFSQFFISPLVKAEAMEREVLAVDSEFKLNLQSDGSRLQQLQCHTSTPGNPFNKFFCGNKKSLMDAMDKGIDMREQILKLYEETYLGGQMKLVVIGGESLETLESWVVELFSDVREGNRLRDNFKNGPIWDAGKLYWLEAVKDIHILNLTWQLPCLDKEYLKKPQDYLAHLIGHESSGSLHSFLKRKGWVTSLSAGVGEEGVYRSSIGYIFVVSIYLTDLGLDKAFEVVGTVYQYLRLLCQAGPQSWVFKELQDIGNMEFRFAEEQPQDEYAAELAENLLLYPEEHIIYGDYAFEVWDERLVEHVLSFLSPDNMRIDILSKSFDKKPEVVKYEPWFGSRYTEESIQPSLLELWRNPLEIDPSLHLPQKNEFVPCDFSIRSSQESEDRGVSEIPKCIIDEPNMKLWYKLDTTFKVPRANTYFLITVKEAYTCIKQCVLTELFVSLLRDELNEILYQADVAKLETSLSISGDRIEVKLYGFNDKLPTLLSKILSISRSFLPSEDHFKVIKENMERTFRNSNMKPLNHSSYLRLQVLRNKFWDVDDKLSCLADTSLSDLKNVIPRLLSQLYIEGICHGNILEEEALNIANIFRDIFPVPPLPKELRHEERVLHLPSGTCLIRNANVKNNSEVNSVVELYFQIEPDKGVESTRSRVMADLFEEIIGEPCFNQLRTKEQLGYVVECDPRMTFRVIGFCFRVQSSRYGPLYLQERVDNFIDKLQEVLDGLDQRSFENYRSGLIAKKLEKDPSLSYETDHYWGQIFDRRYLFNMSKMEAEELKRIEKEDVIEWYNAYFKGESEKCCRLAIHVWGCTTNMEEDLEAFKLSSKFYPSLC
ncbi:hypothetical protein AMTR_s00077p00061270 [Amborella trichopoda]|uniref:Peptidase M16 N-terminal domain-containing protein n=1 Tax=Amborella trichopoda TaxID=13333 RepID=W1P2P4_AMBTC|nr:hypothetical protein AMTR_s00077p00061270 [Amborella trichopoda]